MRCDDFLPWLESGGAQAEAARRHADVCANCRAAAAMLECVKAELAVRDPMPAAMRAAMLGMAEHGTRADMATNERSAALRPAGSPRRRSLWIAAIAASLVGAALSVWRQRQTGDEIARPLDAFPERAVQTAERPADVRSIGPITVVTVDSSRELATLADELAELQRTLADAKAGAERLAVNQALDRVLLDFQRTVAVRASQ